MTTKTRPTLTVLPALLATLLSGSAITGEPAPDFATKPAATKAGDKVKIGFAVSASTDVEVAVLDQAGKVVRHLAAGVLGGKNPPPEPLKPGLAQEVVWDGRDDLGHQVSGVSVQESGNQPDTRNLTPDTSFRVRVRAGLSVKFGRIIGTSPYTGDIGGFDMVAVAADGTLYIKKSSTIRKGEAWELARFDKSGKYQKTLLPYAPSTDPARASGFRLIDAGDGLVTPACRSALDPVLLDFGGTIHHTLVNGSVVFIDNSDATMTFFKVDGSNAVKTVPMRTAKDKLKWSNFLSPQIAFSPDGKYAYYSNLASTPTRTKRPSDIDPKFPQGRVYRHDLTKPGTDPEKFYDLDLPDWEKAKYWLPNAWNKKSAAVGIDVDANGDLFVCDLVNQEVVKVSPEGKKLSATKAPWPDKVLVGSKADALYVLSAQVSESGVGYGRPPSELLKLSGRGADARVVARLRLRGALGQSLALDESGDVPALWVGGGMELLRIEDRGTNFVVAGTSLLNSDSNAVNSVVYGDVDAEAELVYIAGGGVWRYNGDSGEGGRAPIGAVDLAIGPGGMIYAWGTGGYQGPVTRYDRDYKPAPLASTGRNSYGDKKSPEYTLHGRMGRGLSVAGLDVDRRGWVYAAHGVNDALVQVFDAEGKLVEFERKTRNFGRTPLPAPGMPALVSGIVDQSGSVRVDLAGNVYVLQIGLPRGHTPPKGFEKDPSYLGALGTIYKLGPGGGEFERQDKKLQPATGLLQSYSTPCGTVSGGLGGGACHCTKPRFDVDGYGRLYIPNTFTYKVAVVDNADNPILSFGGYGNWDAQGPQSSEPKPEIPLGWPIFAGASDKYVYVGDVLNHRVVRADKIFAAEETCDVN